ncbi:hypothetical protein F441_22128 [Phytophthora nicotianae CJ01A1]|nr:hypothetical protein L915_21618 [Phytophthora nicotianae]ETL24518.1 hypothetical protein L916_21489 [Phytophthora nicotianae]ETP00458.1 hypothetical protein F441_22128 [Phytophthora nicotianae CJ01A1]KUF82630.1 hypothetical protein AM587_10003881 [Phytophthora nicotianae]KUF82631.1 hypothetical protein AM587_10001154 [Phytophthora nicotianae]
MKTSYLQVFVILAAVSSGIYTTATITVSSSTTKQAKPSTDLYKYAKQWTVSGSSNSDKIDTLDISLTGNVFMSYTDSLPKGVLGYLNVSGDSQTVVDAVTVTYKRFLNVSAAATQSGNVLTEILLSSSGEVAVLDCSRSANVVIEDGVLVTSSSDAGLVIDISDSAAVYVSTADAALSTNALTVDVSENASLQINAKSVSLGDVTVDVGGSASISVLTASFKSADIVLDVENGGAICIDADEVTTGDYTIEGGSKISMPKASNKLGSTGTFACDNSSVPVRELGFVTDSVSGSSMGTSGEAPLEESSSHTLAEFKLKVLIFVGLTLLVTL